MKNYREQNSQSLVEYNVWRFAIDGTLDSLESLEWTPYLTDLEHNPDDDHEHAQSNGGNDIERKDNSVKIDAVSIAINGREARECVVTLSRKQPTHRNNQGNYNSYRNKNMTLKKNKYIPSGVSRQCVIHYCNCTDTGLIHNLQHVWKCQTTSKLCGPIHLKWSKELAFASAILFTPF